MTWRIVNAVGALVLAFEGGAARLAHAARPEIVFQRIVPIRNMLLVLDPLLQRGSERNKFPVKVIIIFFGAQHITDNI